jgi:NAD(P)-dependent dehydrogenase (short-subunit alcohol dehydrogenase family)
MASTNRLALITGANKGLGLETVRQLSKLDIRCIVTARDEQKLSVVKHQFDNERIDADYHKLDVRKQIDIDNIKNYVTEKYTRLDILINNAGISLEKTASYQVNTTRYVSIETIKEVYETNIFGAISLTQALLPLIEKSDAGRIVNVSSELGSLTLHADRHSPVYHLKKFAYNSSKTLLNQFTVHLAQYFMNSNTKINSVSPGWVKTDMGSPYAPLEIPDGVKIIVAVATLPNDGPNGQFITHSLQPILW